MNELNPDSLKVIMDYLDESTKKLIELKAKKPGYYKRRRGWYDGLRWQ